MRRAEMLSRIRECVGRMDGVIVDVSSLRLLLLLHELDRLVWILGIQVLQHDHAEFFEIDRLGDIGVEASRSTLVVDIAQDVGRKSDDWHDFVLVLLLPPADLPAGLIAVFVRHVEIALQ